MYLNRSLLLLFGLVLIFLPTIENWLWQNETGWYRPYILWFGAVIAAWWNQRTRYRDEL